MSVSSYGFDIVNVSYNSPNTDENTLFSLPQIEMNNAGLITAIVQGDIENNTSLETSVVLDEATTTLSSLEVVLNNLSAQVSQIAIQTNSLKNQVDALDGNVDTLLDDINTLIENISIATTGYVTIVDNFTFSQLQQVFTGLNGTIYWKRRQKATLYNGTLNAGIYVANFNWVIENMVQPDVATGPCNDPRYKLTYAYVDVNGGDNIVSSVNNCSGHNGLNISHSSSMCFELTTPTNVNFGIMFDIASTSFTGADDLTYRVNNVQEDMYPSIPINSQIIQVIKIA
jgi:hypothetical protein